MKLLSVFLLAIVAVASFQGCDAKPTETIKTVHDTDTVYTDRFAHNTAVVWGEWNLKMKSSTDTAHVVFLQDTTSATAYVFWSAKPAWLLAGNVTAQGLRLTTDTLILSGKFTDSASGKKTRITGLIVNTTVANLSADSFTAVRIR